MKLLSNGNILGKLNSNYGSDDGIYDLEIGKQIVELAVVDYLGYVGLVDNTTGNGTRTYLSLSSTITSADTIVAVLINQSSTSDWNTSSAATINGATATKEFMTTTNSSYIDDGSRFTITFYSATGIDASSITVAEDVVCSDVFRSTLYLYKISGKLFPTVTDTGFSSWNLSSTTASTLIDVPTGTSLIAVGVVPNGSSRSWTGLITDSDDVTESFLTTSCTHTADTGLNTTVELVSNSSGFTGMAAIAIT